MQIMNQPLFGIFYLLTKYCTEAKLEQEKTFLTCNMCKVKTLPMHIHIVP